MQYLTFSVEEAKYFSEQGFRYIQLIKRDTDQDYIRGLALVRL